MTPDLEEMIRQRAHEIWEQEGRPHGSHEEHWHRAVTEVTRELDRIKAMETPAAEDIMAATTPRKARQGRTASAEQVTPPRPRRASRTAAGAEGAGAGGAAKPGGGSRTLGKGTGQASAEKPPRKRAAKRVGDEAPSPAGDAAPRTPRRSRKIEAE